jgi:hypothetical protein
MELVSSNSENFHFLAFLSLVKLLDPILDQSPLLHKDFPNDILTYINFNIKRLLKIRHF